MRIISGTARGRKLVVPSAKDNTIRPTADRAREALFSILGQRILDAQVLDLFAGTGALGLEAFSRGARRVVFVDNGRTALQILRQNLSIFSNTRLNNNDFIIIKDDLRRPAFAKKIPQDIKNQYDVIFADPPYDKGFALQLLQYICNGNMLGPKGIVVVEERHNTILPENLAHLKIIDKRTYGEASFTLYQTRQSVDNNCDTTIGSKAEDKGADT